jgi:hypothetical protein
MRWLVLAVLCLGSSTFLLGSTEAQAFGWYRTYGDYAVALPGCYRFPSPRWNFAAAHYNTYPRFRHGGYGRLSGCR